jgi:tetratricopeptide (TPR) repeat protein
LWARYRAERSLWYANRILERLRLGLSDKPAELAVDASVQLDRIIESFPASTWATPDALRRRMAADVARISGTAGLWRAQVDEDAGRQALAEREYETTGHDFTHLDAIAVPAAAGAGRCLERLDREEEAVEIRRSALQRPWVDPAVADVYPDMPGLATDHVRLLEWLGRSADADSVRTTLLAMLSRERRRWTGKPAACDLAVAAADLEASGGHLDAARQTLRYAMAEAAPAARRGEILVALARRSREAVAPDTVAAYAAWAAREFPGPIEAETQLELARAWQAAGVAETALEVYKRLIDSMPQTAEVSAIARHERAALLERLDRWEAARSELRTLATLQPGHALGLDAQVAIVRHNVRAGEMELARIEGRQAIDALDRLLLVQRDAGVQRQARAARAEVLALIGKPREALHAYAQLWALAPGTPEADWGGWHALMIADTALGDRQAASRWAGQLATRAQDLEVRRRAQRRHAEYASVMSSGATR